MNTNQPFNEYLKAFYLDGYRIGMNVTENQISKNELFSAVEKMHQQIDELIDSVSGISQPREKINSL